MPNRQFQKDSKLRINIKQYLKPYFKISNDKILEPINSWVFIAHYKYTVGILILLFIGLSSSWFASSPMECNLKFFKNELKDFQKDLCLSYPYTLNSKGERVYALHYRWVHWSILVLIPLYSIPLHLKKHFEIELINKYLYYIKNSHIKDPKRNAFISVVVEGYIGYGLHNLYMHKMMILFVTLFVDVVAFLFMDVALQNRFARLFPIDYPFTRWPQFLNDTMSLAFPPFAECKIGIEMMLMNRREDTLGCNLTLMNIYDKVFVAMWLFMVGLAVWTVLCICYYLILSVSDYHKKNLIGMKGLESEVKTAAKHLDVGEIILLHVLFSLLNSEEKEAALKKISSKIKAIRKTESVIE